MKAKYELEKQIAITETTTKNKHLEQELVDLRERIEVLEECFRFKN